jgi:hypothetical protein
MDRTTVSAQVEFQTVAAALAHLCADEQAAFLNVFSKELRHVCETEYRRDLQIAYIVDHLDKDGHGTAQSLGEHSKLEQEYQAGQARKTSQ